MLVNRFKSCFQICIALTCNMQLFLKKTSAGNGADGFRNRGVVTNHTRGRKIRKRLIPGKASYL